MYALDDGMESLVAEPEGLPARFAVVSAAEEAAEFGQFAEELVDRQVALGEFRKGTQGKRIGDALFGGKDPTIPLVLMEDVSALIGLALALAAVVLTTLTGDTRFDALGSVLIGILLATVAVLIARDTHALLIGERATPEMEHKAQEIGRAHV